MPHTSRGMYRLYHNTPWGIGPIGPYWEICGCGGRFVVSSLDQRMWDERYGTAELVWGSGPNRFLVDEVTDLRPGSALDAACGENQALRAEVEALFAGIIHGNEQRQHFLMSRATKA